MPAQELRWLTYLLNDLGEQPRSPPVLYVDNKAMIALCQKHRLEHRTKHIAQRYFLARELQQRGQLRLAFVATRANTADIFTKALPPGDHQRFSKVLGLKAMESELKSIEENGTWELVELPEGRKAITSKWLFKIKSDADGKIERYKSRLVAKGYQQKEKVDYKELFAPVVKPTTLRTLLAGAAIKGWVVKQMDVTMAFLNGILEEEIFMAQPEGFDDGSGRVLKLKKALY
ncbi:unnamed protein product [Closterium sp. NIES-53]